MRGSSTSHHRELATELLDRRGSLDDQRRLANLYRKRRIASRAIELSAAAWASSINIHGRENEITLGLMRDSAEAYNLLPDAARVRSILDEGLGLATRELGAQNVLTRRFKSARNSAFKGFAASQLRERQAKTDYQHAVETHGPTAEATLKAWDNWIIQLTSIGEIEASRKQVESYVERCQSTLGPEHPTSLRARHTQAWHAQHSGEDERAEKLFRLLIEAEQSLLPPGHALTMVTLRTFSDFLLRRDRQADALAIIDSWQDKLAGSEWPPDSFDVLVPRASRWRFLNQSTDEGTAWKEFGVETLPTTSGSSWRTGIAPFGYGIVGAATSPQLVGNRFPHTTFYFRQTFEVGDPARYSQLKIRLLREGGAAVYINGHEVARDKLAAAAAFDTLAENDWQLARSAYFVHIIEPSSLRAGRNSIAVEVHQESPNSTDMAFGLELSGRLGEELAE